MVTRIFWPSNTSICWNRRLEISWYTWNRIRTARKYYARTQPNKRCALLFPVPIDPTAWVRSRCRSTDWHPTERRTESPSWSASCISESRACRWTHRATWASRSRSRGSRDFRDATDPNRRRRSRTPWSCAASVVGPASADAETRDRMKWRKMKRFWLADWARMREWRPKGVAVGREWTGVGGGERDGLVCGGGGSIDWGCCDGMRRRMRWVRAMSGFAGGGGGGWSGVGRRWNAAERRQTIWTEWNALNWRPLDTAIGKCVQMHHGISQCLCGVCAQHSCRRTQCAKGRIVNKYTCLVLKPASTVSQQTRKMG